MRVLFGLGSPGRRFWVDCPGGGAFFFPVDWVGDDFSVMLRACSFFFSDSDGFCDEDGVSHAMRNEVMEEVIS